MPFKTFTSGEILTAADVNTYIMGQQIAVFAGTAARGSAITAPTEGQFAWLSDIDKLTYFDGTDWQEI